MTENNHSRKSAQVILSDITRWPLTSYARYLEVRPAVTKNTLICSILKGSFEDVSWRFCGVFFLLFFAYFKNFRVNEQYFLIKINFNFLKFNIRKAHRISNYLSKHSTLTLFCSWFKTLCCLNIELTSKTKWLIFSIFMDF